MQLARCVARQAQAGRPAQWLPAPEAWITPAAAAVRSQTSPCSTALALTTVCDTAAVPVSFIDTVRHDASREPHQCRHDAGLKYLPKPADICAGQSPTSSGQRAHSPAYDIGRVIRSDRCRSAQLSPPVPPWAESPAEPHPLSHCWQRSDARHPSTRAPTAGTRWCGLAANSAGTTTAMHSAVSVPSGLVQTHCAHSQRWASAQQQPPGTSALRSGLCTRGFAAKAAPAVARDTAAAAPSGFVNGHYRLEDFPPERIRNFGIIAHVDHGANRMQGRYSPRSCGPEPNDGLGLGFCQAHEHNRAQFERQGSRRWQTGCWS